MRRYAWFALGLLAVPAVARAGGAGGLFDFSSYGSSISADEIKTRIQKERNERMIQELEARRQAVNEESDSFDAPASAPDMGMPNMPVQKRPASKVGGRMAVMTPPPPPPPPPPPAELAVWSASEEGRRVAVATAELGRLGPPAPPPAPPAPTLPRTFTAGAAKATADLRSGRATVLWSFEKAGPGPAPLALDLPRAVRVLELDGQPAALSADGSLPIPGPGPHQLAVEYRLELAAHAGFGEVELWLPAAARTRVTADLAAPRLAPSLSGARDVVVEDVGGRTRLTGLVAGGGTVTLRWEERVEGLAPLADGSAEADLSAAAVTLFTLRGPELEVDARIRWTAGAPGVNRLALALPAALEVLEILDGQGKPWPQVAVAGEGAARRLVLGLPARQEGELSARIRLVARPPDLVKLFEQGSTVELDLPRLVPQGAGRVPEFLGLVKDPRLKAGLTGAFQHRARTDFPAWSQAQLPPEAGNLARALEADQEVGLTLEMLRSLPPRIFEIVRAEAETVLSPHDGSSLTRVVFQVRNNSEQFLRVSLPPGSKVRGAAVRGNPVKPGLDPTDPNRILLALALSAGAETAPPVEVELFFQSPLAGPGWMGTLDLALARPEADVSEARWILHHPDSLHFTPEESARGFRPSPTARRNFANLSSEAQQMMSRRVSSYGRADKSLRAERGMASNIMASQMAFGPGPSAPDPDRRATGLLPIEIRLPELRELRSIELVQGAVSKDGEGWSCRIGYVDRGAAGWLSVVASVLLAGAGFLALLWTRGLVPRQVVLATGAAALAGVLGARWLGQPLADPILAGVLGAAALGALWLVAWPLRYLSRAAAAALVLAAAGLATAGERVAALAPAPRDGEVPLATGSRPVLVPADRIEALQKLLEERAKPKPAVEPDTMLFGDQELVARLDGDRAVVEVTIPIRIKGRGPWVVPLLAGDLSVQEATVRAGRGRPEPAALLTRQDAQLRALDDAVLGRYGGYLSGTNEDPGDSFPVSIDAWLDVPSPTGYLDFTYRVVALVAVEANDDGSSSLSLTPPDGSARKLALTLPGEVGVTVEGDSRPRVEERADATVVAATPPRSGPVEVRWSGRARHAAAAPMALDPPEPPPGPASPEPAAAAPPAPRRGPELSTLFEVDWEVALTVGEEQASGVAVARLQLLRGSLDGLELELPKGVKLASVKGDRLAGYRALEDRGGQAVYGIGFRSRPQEHERFELAFRIPFEGPATGGSRTFRVPRIAFAGAAAQHGRIGLAREGSQELEVARMDGAEPEPAVGREAVAMRFQVPDHAVDVEVKSHTPVAVFPAALVGASASTKIDGELREVSMTMELENNGRDFVAFSLPEGTDQDSIQIRSGQGAGPQGMRMESRILDREGRLRVPLAQPPPGSRQPARVFVELKFRQKRPAPDGAWGSERIALPTPDLPLAGRGLDWTLSLARGYVWSGLEPGGLIPATHPYRAVATVHLPGFVPPRGERDARLELALQAAWISGGALDGLMALALLALAALSAGLGLVASGRLGLGPLPRLAVLAAATALAAPALDLELPLPGWAMGLAVLAGLVLLRKLSPRAPAVLLGLLALMGTVRAEPAGVDFRYLPPEELAARLQGGGWRSMTAQALQQLVRRIGETGVAEPAPRTPPRGPLVLSARHLVVLAGETARSTSDYQVLGRDAGAWSMPFEIGSSTALVGVSLVDAAGKATALPVRPAGGVGSPADGHPRPGAFEAHGLAGARLLQLRVETARTLARSDRQAVLQLDQLPAPQSSFEVRIDDRDLNVEVFPALRTQLAEVGNETRASGWLRPSSALMIRFAPRSSREAPGTETPGAAPVAAEFDAELDPFYRLEGRELHGEHRLAINVGTGGIDRFRFTLPAGPELLGVSGSELAGFEPVDSGAGPAGPRRFEVLLSTRRGGNLSFSLRTLTRLPAEKDLGDRLEQTVDLAGIAIEGASRQIGVVRIDFPAGSAAQPLETARALRTDPRELGPHVPAGSLCFRTLTEGYRIKVQAVRFRKPSIREQAALSAVMEIAPLGGDLAAYSVDYQLSTRGYQSLRVRLPEGASLVSAEVSGIPVKPGAAGAGEFRIPLSSQEGGRTELPVRIVYLDRPPAARVVPPVLLDTALGRLEVRIHHAGDQRLRSAAARWRKEGRMADFFEPVHELTRELPQLAVMIPAALVYAPFQFLGATRSGQVDRLLDTVGDTLSSVPAPSGGAFPQAPPPQAFEGGEDPFGGDREMLQEQRAAGPRMQTQAVPRPAKPSRPKPAEPSLVGEGFQGALPVRLAFAAPGLARSAFHTQLVPAGDAPVLELAVLARWQERIWLALALLLSLAGAFFALRGSPVHPGAVAGAALGLATGLAMNWLYGSGGEVAWTGIAAGAVAGLAARLWIWSRGDERGEAESGD